MPIKGNLSILNFAFMYKHLNFKQVRLVKDIINKYHNEGAQNIYLSLEGIGDL